MLLREPKEGLPGRKSRPPTTKEGTLDRGAEQRRSSLIQKQEHRQLIKNSFKEGKVYIDSMQNKENTRCIKGNALIFRHYVRNPMINV